MNKSKRQFIAELDDPRVACTRLDLGSAYPRDPPFHPDQIYAELGRLHPDGIPLSTVPNPVYAAVRRLFRSLGFDAENVGTAQWNPLKGLVKPGDVVVVKPNWVKECNLLDEDSWEEVITHPSVLRPIVDYVLLALEGEGRVIITDGPQTDSSFGRIMERINAGSLEAHFGVIPGNVRVEILDLRQEEHETRDGVVVRRRKLRGDPRGYVEYDLGLGSEFIGHRGRYFGASFDVEETNRAHNGTTHLYRISGTVACADVVINVPKLKTHKKAGITCALKNMVGINGWKNYLPHHSEGTPSMGGDQFPWDSRRAWLEYHLMGRFKRVLNRSPEWVSKIMRFAKRPGRVVFGDTEEVVRSGNWYGNDTLWRMVLDLNKILLYGTRDARLEDLPVRRYLAVVDGIVGGEGNGPMCPDRVDSGILLAGRNPVAVDLAAATVIGLDPRRMPSVRNGTRCRRWLLARFHPDDAELVLDENETRPLWAVDPQNWVRFRPHFGWAGELELKGPIGPGGFDAKTNYDIPAGVYSEAVGSSEFETVGDRN